MTCYQKDFFTKLLELTVPSVYLDVTKSGEDTQTGQTSEGQLPQESTGEVTEGTQGGEPAPEGEGG